MHTTRNSFSRIFHFVGAQIVFGFVIFSIMWFNFFLFYDMQYLASSHTNRIFVLSCVVGYASDIVMFLVIVDPDNMID